MMKEASIKYELIKTLSDGEFHSGEQLGSAFGMSRAAISKHMKGIQELGLEVFSVQRKGYKLAKPLYLLDQASICASTKVGTEVYPEIDSTNQHLLEKVALLSSGDTCLAEYQSKGRGRRGREWVSPFGSNLYVSMYWRLDAGMAAAVGLSLVVGVAVAEALEAFGIPDIKLKWPNDLYYQDKKLAGILVEMTGQAGGAAHLVLGMGLNIVMADSTENIGQPWTSVSHILESDDIDRNALAITVINAWKSALEDYELYGMAGFVPRWNRLDNFKGRSVKLIMGPREIHGVVQGINEQGAILLETSNGVESYVGGEISLRKND